MFPRVNEKKQTNNSQQPKDENVQKEKQIDEKKQPMGNEAAQNMMNWLLEEPEPKRGNKNQISGKEYLEQLKEEDKKKGIADNIDNIINENNIDNIDNENSIANGDLEKSKDSILNILAEKGMREKMDDSLVSNINNASKNDEEKLIIDTSSKSKEKKEEKEKNDEEDPAIEFMKPLEKKNVSTYEYAPDPDMVVETPKMSDKQKKRRNAAYKKMLDKLPESNLKIPDRDHELKEHMAKKIRENKLGWDLDLQNEEMEKVKNWNFHPVKMKEVKKEPGKFRKFLSWVSRGIGKLFGAPARPAVSMVKKAGERTNQRKQMQQKRRHDLIPGWDGKQFDKKATKGEDVLADFRRVPTVWSYMTSQKAVDDEGKPLDPVVSVYADQPKDGSHKSMVGLDLGHIMIGIEYSRFSKATDQYERYDVRYGFYPAGGTVSTVMGGSAALSQDAIFPGQMMDDRDHPYSVSRSYRAKPEQVNAIIKASETYADGGYGYYKRNCTTFVKNMVVDVAHLATGGEIFKDAEVRFSSMANMGIVGASMFGQAGGAEAGSEGIFTKLSDSDDLTYQGIGNKRATREDYNRYKNSINDSGSAKFTYTPADTGELMRRTEGDQAGMIGSWKYNEPLLDKNGNIGQSLRSLARAVENQGTMINGKLNEVLGGEYMGSLPINIIMLVQSLPNAAESLRELDEKARDESEKAGKDKLDLGYLTPDEIRNAREKINTNISLANTLLMDYFKNDARIHHEFMKLFSLLTCCAKFLDNVYRDNNREKITSADLGEVRDNLSMNEYKVEAGGKAANFTPTHYESYLQIYKTPEAAVDAYSRLEKLHHKKNNNQKMTKEEQKQYAKLKRLELLAKDYDKAHRYMLEKDEFSQDDVDYAFALADKEQQGDVGSDMLTKDKSAGKTYQLLILEKIFKGQKERVMRSVKESGLSEKLGDVEEAKKWLDRDMLKCVLQHYGEMEKVVRGIRRSMNKADKEKLTKKVFDLLSTTWMTKIFDIQSNDIKERESGINLSMAVAFLMNEKESKFRHIIEQMVKSVLAEDNKRQPRNVPTH